MPKDNSHYIISKCKETGMFEVIDTTMEGFPVVFINESIEECKECKMYLDEIEEYRREEKWIII